MPSGAGTRPSDIAPKGWKDILWRLYHNISEHRVIAIAAGVAFYVLLAIFPGIAALVAIYGFIADPSTISQHISDLSGVLPGGATEVIGDQLQVDLAAARQTRVRPAIRRGGLALERECWHEGALRRLECCL